MAIDAGIEKLPFQGVGYFKVVSVIVTRVESFVTLVVGNRMERLRIGEAVVIAVNDLT